MTDEPPLLLDTHAWIWLQQADRVRLKRPAMKTIEAASAAGKLRLAAISLWEVAMLESKGRVKFVMPCLAWLHEALATPGLAVMHMTPEIAAGSCCLPGKFHGDPADQIIAATARSIFATIVTRDRRILNYAKHGHITAMAI